MTATQRPAPVGSTAREASERAVLASLLDANGADLPPTLTRLLDHAPESWSDPRHGAIACGVRRLRGEGRAVTPDLLLPTLAGDQTGAALLLGTLGDGLPLDLAEIEADSLWTGYQTRRTTQLLAEALEEIDRQPDMAAAIASVAAKGLAELTGDRQAGDWCGLVEDGADIVTEQLPAVVQIVRGIVAEECKLVIGSGSKSFKTWLTLDLSLSVAHGAPFLERATTRKPVLYVNLELRPQTFKRRVQAIAKAKGIDFNREWFLHLPLRGKLSGLSVREIVTRIIRLAQRLNVRVVVVDPVYKLNIEGDENSAADQTRLFNELDRITTEAGCTLVLNDHFSKGNQSEKDPLDAIRGSSAKGGDVDAAMILRKHEVEGCFRVDIIHRELSPVEPFVIGWDFPLMELRPDLNAAAMKKPKGGRRPEHDPADLLRAMPPEPVSVSGWAERAGISRQTLQSYLPKLRAKGLVTTIGEGNGARQKITQRGLEAIR